MEQKSKILIEIIEEINYFSISYSSSGTEKVEWNLELCQSVVIDTF